jgi:hypothetical protein
VGARASHAITPCMNRSSPHSRQAASNFNIVLQKKSVGDLSYRNLSFFPPCLLALGIRGEKAHSDQIANRLGTLTAGGKPYVASAVQAMLAA